ncbi:amidohydrolase, partial [Microbacterium testaceum]
MRGLHAEVERRVPDEVQAAADLELKRNGLASLQASGRMIGERFPRLTDVRARLEAMDAQGVDRQVVCASPNHFTPG